MRVLIGCEESGVVRDAFLALGHDAWSCDILPRAHPRHIRADLLTQNPKDYDLIICFPPCTHLCVSGARHFARKSINGTQRKGIEFFLGCADMVERCGCGGLENPVGIMSTRYRKPDQIIQPWQYGHGETKATCLWLFNLPQLVPTNIVDGRSDRIHQMAPGPKRSRLRSATYIGIARAMAAQWSILSSCSPPYPP